MANPFGSGTALVIPLPSRVVAPSPHEVSVDEPSTIRVREAKAVAPAASPNDSPAVLELLGSLVGLLNERDDGLTAQELRLALSAKPDLLQRALAAGLRARRLRRSGSRCRLRYILNA
jgi:hypothetical protein